MSLISLVRAAKYIWRAFIETANLVALFPILLLTAWLTQSQHLIFVGVVLELLYLLVAYISAAYKHRLESRSQARPRNQALLLISVAGLVIILFFGFGKHLLSHRFFKFNHVQGWEAGALSWTGLFLLYYLAKLIKPSGDHATSAGTRDLAIDKSLVSIFSVAGALLIWRAWNSMNNPLLHMVYVLLISLCLFGIDFRLSRVYPESTEKTIFRLVDAPMIVAFCVLIAYLWVHPDTEHPEAFVSGVVAFELLISNVIFVVTEYEILKREDSPLPLFTHQAGAGSPGGPTS